MEGRYATGKLARLSAPIPGLLPGLPFADNDPHKIHSLASGVATGAPRGTRRRRIRTRAESWTRSARARGPALHDSSDAEPDQSGLATRITLRPHDPGTGEEVEKEEVVKGYEYQRGQFVTFRPQELKALDVESSEVIDLEKFVPRGEIDPVYFNSPYYLYPDGPIAAETLRVIGAAMAELGVVGIARLTLSRRERPVMVEPRGTGMALFTLRAAEEVRAAQFGSPRATSMPKWSPSPVQSSSNEPGNSILARTVTAIRKHYGS